MAKKKKKLGKQKLPRNVGKGKMPDVNAILRSRAKAMGLSAYALARDLNAAGGEMSEQAVRKFLNGDGGVRASNLGALMEVLKLEIRPRD